MWVQARVPALVLAWVQERVPPAWGLAWALAPPCMEGLPNSRRVSWRWRGHWRGQPWVPLSALAWGLAWALAWASARVPL
jgi:hypothetical protein